MPFPKNFLFQANGPFRTRMAHPAAQVQICCKNCFTILHNQRGQERLGNYFNGFSKRNLIQGNLVNLTQKWYGILIILNLLLSVFINFTQEKGPKGSWKFYQLSLEKKSHLGQFDLFRSFFNVLLGVVKIELGCYCWYWIINQLGHYFIHDYYWILKQSGHGQDP